MFTMWIIAITFIFLVVAVVSVVAIFHGERNHRLIAKSEGLDPEPADFTDIDFDVDDEPLSPVPERDSIEEHDRAAEEFTATISEPIEIIEMAATPLDEVGLPAGDPVVLVEPEPEAEPEVRRYEVIIPKEMEYLTEPDDALDELDAAFLEHMAKPVEDPTPAINVLPMTTPVGPGDPTREHPDDPEVIVPVADPIRRLQEESAGQPPAEWKRWNKP